MINHILHHALFGGRGFTAIEEHCMATWRRVLPGFDIKLWTEENGPKERRFFREALSSKPINCCNYVRYWALHEFGGIYIDNDIELLKPFDLDPACFLSFQRSDTLDDCINTAVMGSVARHPFIARCLQRIDEDHGETWPIWISNGLPTDELRMRGMAGLNVEQDVGDVRVYSKDRFYPFRWDEVLDRSRITDRTFAIHHWGGTWKQ